MKTSQRQLALVEVVVDDDDAGDAGDAGYVVVVDNGDQYRECDYFVNEYLQKKESEREKKTCYYPVVR